jgi:hypothetical protein
MYSQNMSEKIARTVRRILRRETALRVLRGKRLESFNVQDNFYGCASLQVRQLSPLQQLQQQPLICFATRTLPFIQQTQCNFRHPVAYSFSGANFL